jgi:hypothetical protein
MINIGLTSLIQVFLEAVKTSIANNADAADD